MMKTTQTRSLHPAPGRDLSMLRVARKLILLSAASFALGAQAQAPSATRPQLPSKELLAAGQEVTPRDLAAAQAAFTRADTNKDGKLSREEVAAGLPALSPKFDELDKNHDGYLSFEEFAAGFMPNDKR